MIFVYLFLFFLGPTYREETPGQILTPNGSKDVESRKDVPFGGYKMKK